LKIYVLGAGCANCEKFEANVRKAVADLGISAEFEKITDFVKIAGYGVMMLPALVVDEEVVMVGKVASADEIRKVLKVRT
jgi:small redox-active disulfide protein 2